MAAVARKGDPIDHGGEILEGSDNVLTNGIETARAGDAVYCVRHGPQIIVSGSATVLVNGKGCARVGDPISCGAIISDGSPNVFAGG